jgi:hypothetical protein
VRRLGDEKNMDALVQLVLVDIMKKRQVGASRRSLL